MMILATYIVTGALAGFLAGLLGIGGGLIVVPVLVVSFTMQGFAPDVIMPLGVGTSLATIVVTSSVSIRAHHARGNIDWRIFKPTAPGIFVGAVLGLTLSATAPTQLMQIAFVAYASFVALNLLTTPEMPAARRAVSDATFAATGAVVGFVSMLVGVAGASLSVPFMLWSKVPARLAMGTSAALGLPIAVLGTVGYATTGAMKGVAVPDAVGYIYVPAFIAIVLAGTVAAPLGVRMAHLLHVDVLKKIFAAVLILTATRMLLELNVSVLHG